MVQVVDWKPLSWRLVATNKLRLDQGQLVLNGARFENTRLINSTDVISWAEGIAKLGRNVPCPCSRELFTVLFLQML